MIRRFFYLSAFAGLTLAATSCKENPELVRKREEQKTEIKHLEGELSLLDEKLKDVPPDRTKDLAEAKAQAEAQTVELARLEKEVGALEVKKRSLEKTFAEYRSKYPLKSR